jgi:hypothetical protein
MGVQIVEPALPLASKRLNPVGHVFKGNCHQLAWPSLRIPAARNKASVLKDIQVLGDGGLAQIERPHKLRNVRVSRHQAGEDRAARGVRERSEDPIQGVSFIHRHMSILPSGDI